MSSPTLGVKHAVRLTIGLKSDFDLYTIVAGYGLASSDLGMPQGDMLSDFEDYVQHQWFDAWKIVAAVDQTLMGWQVENYQGDLGIWIPYRAVIASAGKIGTVAGDSTPPQTSVLFSFNTVDQANLPDERVKTARNFIGPGPESKWDSGVISDSTYNDNLVLLAHLMKKWTGNTSSKEWTRIVAPNLATWFDNPSPPPAKVPHITSEYWGADFDAVRQNLFTQRRRMRPLF